MRQFRTSGSVRGAAREGGSYRDRFKSSRKEQSIETSESQELTESGTAAAIQVPG